MKRHSPPTGELTLIQQIREASESRRRSGRRHPVQLGIGDDCAILRPPRGHEILITTDFSLEGRHFRRDWHSAESAGHRCLARGLSDLAAMGAKPLAAFLSLALPAGIERKWTDGFLRGLRALADQVNVPLAGGDTARSPSSHVLADIVLAGSAPSGKALRRSTARAGDLLYVTGHLGGSAAELLRLRSGAEKRSLVQCASNDHPHVFPSPRLAVGQALLRRHLATACIDLSDGLSSDLKHLCDESSLSASIDLAALPIHRLARRKGAQASLALVLHGGEDYELLFAARPSTRVPKTIAGVPVAQIGSFSRRGRKSRMTLIDERGQASELKAAGWEHSFG